MDEVSEVEGAKHTVSHYVKRYVSNAIARHSQGDEFEFEVMATPIMGPQGIQGYAILAPIFMRGPLLGSWISGTLQAPFSDDKGGGVLTKTEDEWDEMVRETLEQMRQARSDILAQGNGNGPAFGMDDRLP